MSKLPRTNFRALIESDVAPAFAVMEAQPEPMQQTVAPDLAQASAPVRRSGTLKQRTRQQSLYLEVPVHDALREIAFHERTSLHALYLEGIDAVLKKRGSPSIKELLRAKSKPVL